MAATAAAPAHQMRSTTTSPAAGVAQRSFGCVPSATKFVHAPTPLLPPVPETTPLAEAVGSALPLYLYRPASARSQGGRVAVGAAPEAHQRDMPLDSEPQVPEWCERSVAGEEQQQQDALAMALQQCQHQQHGGKWASPMLIASSGVTHHQHEDAGVVPMADNPAAPRRSLSLSAINHQAGSQAIAVPPTPSARPPLLFRGLSAANLSLLPSIPSSDNRSHPAAADLSSSDGMLSPGGSSSSAATPPARLPHVLAATTTSTPLTMDAVMARSALYRLSSGGDGDSSAAALGVGVMVDASDDAMSLASASPMEASPRSSSPMLPDLALGAPSEGMEQLLRMVAASTREQHAMQGTAAALRLAWLQRRLREHQPGTLDSHLAALWEDCDARGLFRYDVAACATRVLRDAPLRWVVQLNEGRATKKRPTELKLDAVLQPFDAARFHFGKAAVREALMQFEPLASSFAGQETAGPFVYQQEAGATGARLVESSAMPADPTLVLINVSPIEHGHVLLTPRVLSRRPQRLGDVGVIGEALAFAREVGSPAFRLGYNALGAYASINHLHFQGYYLHEPFPCELADVTPLASTPFVDGVSTAALARFERSFPHVQVGVLAGYPVLGWVVEQWPVEAEGRHGEQEEGGREAEREMALVLARLTAGLEERDQPYNVFVVDCGRRAYVWPQCFAARQAAGQVDADLLDSGVNPAAFEIAGHLLVKRPEDYTAASDAWAHRLLGAACLPAEDFGRLTRECLLMEA